MVENKYVFKYLFIKKEGKNNIPQGPTYFFWCWVWISILLDYKKHR